VCTIVEMHFASRRQIVIARNSGRNVLFAHRNEGSGGKSIPRRILLAFGRGRRSRNRANMPKLSEACPLQQVPTRRGPSHTLGLAPCTMGHRYCRTPANSSRQLQVCSSRCRVLFKVDRSQGASRYHCRHPA